MSHRSTLAPTSTPSPTPSSTSTSNSTADQQGNNIPLRRSGRRQKPQHSTGEHAQEADDSDVMAALPSSEPSRTNGEEEAPLLGGPGGAKQKDDSSIIWNFVSGTALLTQPALLALLLVVTIPLLTNISPILFILHPILNTLALVLSANAILALQPTSSPAQKRNGAAVHAFLQNLALACFIAGITIIEIHKYRGGAQHFYSPHGILGLVVYVLFAVQALGGIVAYFAPGLLGGVAQAKKTYKFHRAAGYVVFPAGLATVCVATITGFNKSALHVSLPGTVVCSVVIALGVGARIRKSKLGL